jgi:hypothetical protein
MPKNNAHDSRRFVVANQLRGLIGRTCTKVYEGYPGNFTFDFDDKHILGVDCLWRLLGDGRVLRTSLDHGQQFGLPRRVDAFSELASFLMDRKVKDVQVRAVSADLALQFDGDYSLEIIPDTSGYESWKFDAPGVSLVAQGGGNICDLSSTG